MSKYYISLNDISPQGRNVTVDDPAVWEGPLAEFHMDCRVVQPLRAELFLLPTGGGCLVRGALRGEVVVPCDRCAEDTHVQIAHEVEVFEVLPGGDISHGGEAEDEEADAAADDAGGHIRLEKGIPMLDIGALCWEEFMLALPMRPLCTSQCKGLCAQCGANLNAGSCGCVREDGDPRLAALRHFKVQKPDK